MTYEEIKKSIVEYTENMKNIRLLEFLDDTNEVNVAEVLENEFTAEQIIKLFRKINKEKVAEIFAYFSQETKEKVISLFSDEEIKIIFEYMFTDDISEFLDQLPEERVNKVLSAASKQRRTEINMILNFKEYSAGSLMSTDYISLFPDITVDEALEIIKKEEKLAETISFCYVTNENNTLLGYISVKTILLAPEKTIISDIMELDVISVDTDEDQEEIAKVFSKYDLIVLPVVNKQHTLMGIITIDDVYDIIQEEITEDLQKMGGITPIDGSYIQMNVFEMFKSRITWLLILMISATVSGWIISGNITLIKHLPSLLIFIPVLMDTAGNAGSQSSTMVVRGIALDNLNIKDIVYVVKKELKNSIILGFLLFVANMIRIVVFMPSIEFKIALLISTTVYIIVLIANLIGGVLPLIATSFKQDPASMSSPILTTVCDAISLTTYFTLARIFLGGGLNV